MIMVQDQVLTLNYFSHSSAMLCISEANYNNEELIL